MSSDDERVSPLVEVTNLTAGVAVADIEAAIGFHRTWLRRDPDLIPQPDVAEWELAPDTWIQFFQNKNLAGQAVMRLGVTDAIASREALTKAGIDVTEVEEVGGFLRFCDFRDPDGNRFTLVELTEDS